MIINTNMASLNTIRQLSVNEKNTQSSLAKLSSGLRINSAADDAAGLAISEKMRGQISGLNQASSNAQSGINLSATAEGALNETTSILQRMRELAVQSANDTATDGDRTAMQQETDQLASEITRISNTTEFNTKNLLAGGLNATFQIGANANQNMSLSINAMDAASLGVAANKNYVSSFTDGGTATGLTQANIGTIGSGLTAQNYSIAVTQAAASTSVSGTTLAGGVTAAGSYTGTQDQLGVQFKITSLDGSNKIATAQYSTDAGTTWNTATVNGSNQIVYNGATLAQTAAAAGDLNGTITVDFHAQYNTVQLKDSGTNNVGSAVTVYQGQNTVTVGDAATNSTIVLNSTNLGNLANASSATIGIGSQTSSKAVIAADGSIQTEAKAVAGIDISSQSSANNAITVIDSAINKVSAERSKLGAVQNRLEHTINNLGTASQNITSAEASIRDVDMAAEMTNFQKNNILQQAAQAMLAQANQQPQGVLQLLR